MVLNRNIGRRCGLVAVVAAMLVAGIGVLVTHSVQVGQCRRPANEHYHGSVCSVASMRVSISNVVQHVQHVYATTRGTAIASR
jgi:hypothetical protein